MRDPNPRMTARRKTRQKEREDAGVAVPPCPDCIHEHHVVGQRHDRDFVVNRCERHHRGRHELLRKAGISLTPKSNDHARIAAALRALAVHKRAEATSEADAFERWAEALERKKGKEK